MPPLPSSTPTIRRFFVRKLWSYFVPTAPDAATQRALEHLYVSTATQIRPVVEAILKHPALYEGPRMVKSPAVYTAGLLRRLGRGIDTTSWAWLGSMAGQQLFYPPNVAGWDDSRWLDTATWRGRWCTRGHYVLRPALDPGSDATQPSTRGARRPARSRSGAARACERRRAALLDVRPGRARRRRDAPWKRKSVPRVIRTRCAT